jgi:hypothetical protein
VLQVLILRNLGVNIIHAKICPFGRGGAFYLYKFYKDAGETPALRREQLPEKRKSGSKLPHSKRGFLQNQVYHSGLEGQGKFDDARHAGGP